jgi:hypothetical protein
MDQCSIDGQPEDVWTLLFSPTISQQKSGAFSRGTARLFLNSIVSL